MGFEIFKKEAAVIEQAKSLLDGGALRRGDSSEAYHKLLKDYEKLFKSTRKLVRLSDRSEAALNELARTLDVKNKMLEALSAKLAKYLAPQVYQSIFSGTREVNLTTERKKLTVFFSDIKDFTQTTDDLQPEDLTSLLTEYLTEMSRIALDHGATIDKFIGDAMLLFFGDPESRGVKADAKACVEMAITMQNRMRELQGVWHANGFERPFHMRIGINTGYCNVGNFGSNDRMDYTIIGGEVNLAARLEGQCDPDGILLSYESYALVRDLVEVEERPTLKVKGIRKEVRPFAVTNIFDDHARHRRVIHQERDGLALFVDVDRVQTDQRRQALADLEDVVCELKEKWH